MRLISLFFLITLVSLLFSCKKHKDEEATSAPAVLENGMLVLNEGLFQHNNSTLSWVNLNDGTVDNEFFTNKTGRQLGDTGNDIAIYGGKIYVVVNNSNTLEIMDKTTGISIQQISMVEGTTGKQPRSLAFYGDKAYITCYDGYVDVLDTTSLTIVNRIPVGANPEGIAVSGSYLFVANSGGLNFPDVDSTVSVINLNTQQELTRITVGINPGAVKADADGDIYVISRGDYANTPSRMVKINTQSLQVDQTFSFNASGMSLMNNYFLITYYDYNTETSAIRLFDTQTETLVSNSFISTASITTLYGVQYDPHTDKIYCLDAMSYVNTGYVRQFSTSGVLETSYHVGLNPSKILFYE